MSVILLHQGKTGQGNNLKGKVQETIREITTLQWAKIQYHFGNTSVSQKVSLIKSLTPQLEATTEENQHGCALKFRCHLLPKWCLQDQNKKCHFQLWTWRWNRIVGAEHPNISVQNHNKLVFIFMYYKYLMNGLWIVPKHSMIYLYYTNNYYHTCSVVQNIVTNSALFLFASLLSVFYFEVIVLTTWLDFHKNHCIQLSSKH